MVRLIDWHFFKKGTTEKFVLRFRGYEQNLIGKDAEVILQP